MLFIAFSVNILLIYIFCYTHTFLWCTFAQVNGFCTRICSRLSALASAYTLKIVNFFFSPHSVNHDEEERLEYTTKEKKTTKFEINSAWRELLRMKFHIQKLREQPVREKKTEWIFWWWKKKIKLKMFWDKTFYNTISGTYFYRKNFGKRSTEMLFVWKRHSRNDNAPMVHYNPSPVVKIFHLSWSKIRLNWKVDIENGEKNGKKAHTNNLKRPRIKDYFFRCVYFYSMNKWLYGWMIEWNSKMRLPKMSCYNFISKYNVRAGARARLRSPWVSLFLLWCKITNTSEFDRSQNYCFFSLLNI